MRGQTQTPLLTHCTNLCPLNYKGLDNSDRNSGVKLGDLQWSRKSSWHVMLHKFAPKFKQATDWPHLSFTVINIFVRNSGRKTGGKLAAGNGATDSYVFFPLCPLCECRLSQYPCPKFDLAALLYNIYNAYIVKQRSIRATLEMHLFPAKVGAKYALGPTQPPRMPNFQQMSMV